MAINITYQQWLEMYQDDREKIMDRWHDHPDEHRYIVEEVIKRLKRSDSRIYEVKPGYYHGGEFILHAYVDYHEIESYRQFPAGPPFQGFRVYYMSRQPGLGPDTIWPDPEWSSKRLPDYNSDDE